MRFKILGILVFVLLFSCKEKPVEAPADEVKIKTISFLPFQKISLDDLSAFKEVSENWKVAERAYVDKAQEKKIISTEGVGVLVNNPDEEKKDNLFTNLEHGDIELAVDVMMAKGSNSGIYFQGRYEVQLLDSWGVEEPQHGDLGGIYQRWDSIRGNGKEGFEGVAPKVNAAKAPGLWQHFKIIFHAPKFNGSGEKTKNAKFEKVWLNGVLIQEDVELTGPTRAAAFEDEKSIGPLMIQGNHGPVALKNFQYKLFEDKKVGLAQMNMTEYEGSEVLLPHLDSLVPLREVKTDSISANMASGERTRRILKYVGKFDVPESGDYLFDLRLNEAGGLLVVDNDTVVNLNGDYNLDSLGLGKITMHKGTVPFMFIYNKHRPWRKGFTLEIEGPGIQKHALHSEGSLNLSGAKPKENIMVEIENETVAQRSFLMHDGAKRTHCISVGTPQKIHYAYDLEFGSLLKAWSGDFLDATQMWYSRGEKQLGAPAGFTISFHGSPGFAQLENENSEWPEGISENSNRKQLGYEFDENRIPVFSSQIGDNKILDKMVPSKTLRMLHRTIEFSGAGEIWHKVAAGESVEKLPDGTYIVNNESYFIEFSDSGNLKPVVRQTENGNELLVKIPTGKQQVDYSIIW